MINQNIENEKKWHEQKFYIDSGHWTSHPLFASRERHWLKNDVMKIRFYGYLFKYIKNKAYRNNADILIAPVGHGSDYYYLTGMYDKVYGIDISEVALSECPNNIHTKEGNILNSGYGDNSFDIIICSLFLHHVHDIGFEPFIKEFSRLLRSGGTLAILEPSIIYPLSWVFTFLTKIMGNVTGKSKGEKPILPQRLIKVLTNLGFKRIHMRGIIFNHVRFPCILQSFINLIDFSLRFLKPFSQFAESVGWFCEKP